MRFNSLKGFQEVYLDLFNILKPIKYNTKRELNFNPKYLEQS